MKKIRVESEKRLKASKQFPKGWDDREFRLMYQKVYDELQRKGLLKTKHKKRKVKAKVKRKSHKTKSPSQLKQSHNIVTPNESTRW